MCSTFSAYSYSIENGIYTNVAGDAQIQLPEINAYTNNVAVIFSELLPQPVNITVYYAAEDHGYSENYTASINAASGSEKAIFLINEEITTCRIDIGIQTGETFSREKIVINDTSSKITEIAKKCYSLPSYVLGQFSYLYAFLQNVTARNNCNTLPEKVLNGNMFPKISAAGAASRTCIFP